MTATDDDMRMTGPVPRTLNRLTGLRGIAAFMVFLYHAARHTEWVPQDRWVHLGFSGVAFFSVLSGFVLTWTSSPQITVRHFHFRRVVRVYQSHLVVVMTALALPVLAFPVTGLAIGTNLTLTQAWFVPWDVVFGLNAVSWSLSCEMAFYLVDPFVITNLQGTDLRSAVKRIGVWYGLTQGTAVIAGLSSNEADVWAYTNPAVRSGEFASGVMLALAVKRGWRPRIPLWSTAVGTLGMWSLLTLGAPAAPQLVSNVLLTPCFAAVIVSAGVADISGHPGPSASRVAVYLGEISFAFYLVHELVIMNLAPVLAAGKGGTPGLLFLSGVLGVSVVVVVLLHHVVENPAQRMIAAASPRTPSAR